MRKNTIQGCGEIPLTGSDVRCDQRAAASASGSASARPLAQTSVPDPGPFSQDLVSESLRAWVMCALGSVACRLRRSSRLVRRRARRSLSRSKKPAMFRPFVRLGRPYARAWCYASCRRRARKQAASPPVIRTGRRWVPATDLRSRRVVYPGWSNLRKAPPLQMGHRAQRRSPENWKTLMGPVAQIDPRAPRAPDPLRVHMLKRTNGSKRSGGLRKEAPTTSAMAVSPESRKSVGVPGLDFFWSTSRGRASHSVKTLDLGHHIIAGS